MTNHGGFTVLVADIVVLCLHTMMFTCMVNRKGIFRFGQNN